MGSILNDSPLTTEAVRLRALNRLGNGLRRTKILVGTIDFLKRPAL